MPIWYIILNFKDAVEILSRMIIYGLMLPSLLASKIRNLIK